MCFTSSEVKTREMHTPNAHTLSFLETGIVAVWQVCDRRDRWDRSSGCCWYRGGGWVPGRWWSHPPWRCLKNV